MRGSGSCLTGRWGGSDVTRGFSASVSSFSKKIHGSGSSVHPSNRSQPRGKLTMKREIMPDGWLGAWIKAKWQSKRAKRAIGHMGFSTAEMAKLNERLQQLKAKYSKA